MSSAGEILDGLQHALLKLFEGAFELAGEEFLEACDAEHLFVRIHSFGDAVAEEHQGVTRFQLQANGGVFGFRNESNRIRALGEGLLGRASADENG